MFCPFCNDLKKFSDLIPHVKLKHKNLMSTEIVCSACKCVTRDIYTFKKHSKIHETKNNFKEIESATGDIQVPLFNYDDVPVSSDIEPIAEYLNEIIPQQVTSVEEFSKQLKRNASVLVAKYFSKPTVNRKITLDIISNCVNFYQNALNPLKLFHNNNRELSLEISIIQNCFSFLENEYKIFQHFKTLGTYIEPVEESIDLYLIVKNVKGFNTQAQKYHKFQIIPIDIVLTKFLELPGVLDSIITNINKKEQSDYFDSLFKGDAYKTLKEQLPVGILLPLMVYNDDFEINNPIGSRKVLHKIGAVYISILGIPDEFVSQLENILLFQLHRYLNHKDFGNKPIFQCCVDKLKKLVKDGLIINSIKVNFVVFQVVSDNLGANSILGFSKSFLSMNCCRICTADINQRKFLTREDSQLLRDVDNYKLAAENLTHGVEEECIFNQIPYFHVTKNSCVDLTHDLYEGICRYDMGHILHHLIQKNYFTLEKVNERLANLSKKCMDDMNVMTKLPNDCVSKKYLILSASEMSFLINYFGILVGNLVKKNDPVWEYFLLLKEIVSLVTGSVVNDSIIERLQNAIHEHHTMFITYFKEDLKPKYHILTHYPRLMKLFGPLNQFSTIRFEGKHKFFKEVANSMTSRVNPELSLSVKHQLQLSYRLLINRGFESRLEVGSQEVSSIKNLLDFSKFKKKVPIDWLNADPSVVTWVRVNGTLYKKQSVIYMNSGTTDCVPAVLGKICHILVSKENRVSFICEELKITYHNEHLSAYEVQLLTNSYCFVERENLSNYKPTIDHFISNSQRCIPIW
ncbi:uncharacterized protein LOC111694208 [Trichogramma pretiosum]|uniref:uncharacterized protein LOC111694208 n=1 Tax=Trichogramma pretiosum TaxID=7493 RepID=UPI000C71B9EC|nr:uncharacterized protein LOC111694208 [Trichogramma pretiosum]